jgi:succinate dehydrogenase / fumarate reductase membrane anchor subunit
MAQNDPSAAPHIDVFRSQLGRARGLGAAKTGVHHWWAQRLTSLALLPLTVWFVVVILHLAPQGRTQVLEFAHHPLNAVLLLAFILATFHHLQLGLQVVIEDYVHAPTRIPALVCMKAAVALAALACVLSVLRLAL